MTPTLKTLALMIISPPIHHTVPVHSPSLALSPSTIYHGIESQRSILSPPLSLWVLTGFHVKYGDAPKASVSNTDLMWMFHPLQSVSLSGMGKCNLFHQLLFPKHLLCLSYQTDQSTFLSSPSSWVLIEPRITTHVDCYSWFPLGGLRPICLLCSTIWRPGGFEPTMGLESTVAGMMI